MKLRIFGLLLVSLILAVLATITGTVDPKGSDESAPPVAVPMDNSDNSFKDLKIN